MEQLVLIVYVVLSVSMVGLILLQQGKGADAGASFGSGASQTIFGSAGSGTVFSRATAILATLFFLASVGMAIMAKEKAEAARSGSIPVPALEESRAAVPPSVDVPAVVAGAEDVPLEQSEAGPADGQQSPAQEDVPQ